MLDPVLPGQLTPAEVCARLAAGEELCLLDVREDEELERAALPHPYLHLPMGELTVRVGELDPEARWVVVCHHGIRSAHVANFLASQDFACVANLRGGIDAWARDVDPSIPRY